MAVILTSTGITFSDGTSTTTNLIPAGTLMVFQQTAAPTGWTKATTHDNKAFRCVSGAASSGGTTAFTSVFASRTPAGSISISGISGSAGATTLTTPQIPSHTHPTSGASNNGNSNQVPGEYPLRAQAVSTTTGGAGGGGSHTHPFSFTSGTGSFSGTAMDFAVQYVDLIIASKD